ncbi:hypothetical protein IFR05_010058 [Cadophora sp. M221]|nr:hypothetical protein IFR05_010058 [Cadophora sp. M221]
MPVLKTGRNRACRIKEALSDTIRCLPGYQRLPLTVGALAWMREDGGFRDDKDPLSVWVHISIFGAVPDMIPVAFDILQDGLVSKPGSPEDTFERLWKEPSLRISTTTHGCGDYVHLYRNAKIQDSQGLSSNNAWYGRKTSDFGRRYREHWDIISSPSEPTTSRNHYTIARSASHWCAIKLFEIPSWVKDKEEMSAIAEQYTVLILHATNAKLLAVRNLAEIEDRGRWFMQASALQEIAQAVFQKTGWPTDMPSVTGANWSMPMTESRTYASTPWTRTLIPLALDINENTDKAIFTRQKAYFSSKKLAERKCSITLLGGQIAIPSNFPFQRVKNGAVQAIIELNINLSQALRLQYTDNRDDTIRSFYWQASNTQKQRPMFPEQKDSSRVPLTWDRVWMLLEHLLKIDFQPEKPDWMNPVASGRVIQIDFDFLKQQFRFAHTNRYPNPVNAPYIRAFQQNAIEMLGNTRENVVARYPGISLNRTSTACDLCLSPSNTIARARRDCTPKEVVRGLFACDVCSSMRRPCTYTLQADRKVKKWFDLSFLEDTTDVVQLVRESTADEKMAAEQNVVEEFDED